MKTRDLIIKILEENEELESNSIIDKLRKRGRELTYNTIMKHLKEMSDEGILTRKGKKGPEYLYPSVRWEGKRKP